MSGSGDSSQLGAGQAGVNAEWQNSPAGSDFRPGDAQARRSAGISLLIQGLTISGRQQFVQFSMKSLD